MIKSLLRHLYRERRRFGLSALLLFGASVLVPNSLRDPIPHVSSEFIVTALIFLAMPITSIYARKHRHFIEVFAFASLLLSIASNIAPTAPFSLLVPDRDYMLTAVVFGVLFMVSHQFLYGSWSDPLTPKRTFRVVTKMRSSADIYYLWYGLIAMPGHRELYADRELVSVDYADPAHKVIRMIHWAPPDRREEFLVFVDEMEKFKYIKLRMKVVEGVLDNAVDGVTEFRFRDNGRNRKVTMNFVADAIAPRRMLRHWLDDTVGRMMDNRVAAIEWNAEHPNDRRQPVSYDDWWVDTEPVSKSSKDSRSGYRTAHGRTLSDQETKALDIDHQKHRMPRHAA